MDLLIFYCTFYFFSREVLSCTSVPSFSTEDTPLAHELQILPPASSAHQPRSPLVLPPGFNSIDQQAYHLIPLANQPPIAVFNSKSVPVLKFDKSRVINTAIAPIQYSDSLTKKKSAGGSALKKALGGTLMIAHYKPTVSDSTLILDASELNCKGGLTQSILDCSWFNEDKASEYDQLDWLQAIGNANPLKLIHHADTALLPSSPTLVVVSQARPDATSTAYEAMLVSAPIGCLVGLGRLQFKHWISKDLHLRPHAEKNGEPMLSVCWRYLDDRTLRDCIRVRTSNPGPTQAVIDGPIRGPIQLVFLAQGLHFRYKSPAFIFLDEIIFRAEISDDCPQEENTNFDGVMNEDFHDDTSNSKDSFMPPTDDFINANAPYHDTFFHDVLPTPPPTPKRFTIDGLFGPVPSIVPGDPFMKKIELANTYSAKGWTFHDRDQEEAGNLTSRKQSITVFPKLVGIAPDHNNYHVNDITMCSKLICKFKNAFCGWNPRGHGSSGLGKRIGWTMHSGHNRYHSYAKSVQNFLDAKFPDPRQSSLNADLFYVVESEIVEFYSPVIMEFQRFMPTAGTQLAVCLETVDELNDSQRLAQSNVEHHETCIWVSPLIPSSSSPQLKWIPEMIKLPRGKYKIRIMASYDDQSIFNGGIVGLGPIRILEDSSNPSPLCTENSMIDRNIIIQPN